MAQRMSDRAGQDKGVNFDINAFRQAVLMWYDRHGRDLPWRVKGRAHPSPYAVWLSEIMMQQTTIPMGTPYFLSFMKRWPTVADLAAAPEDHILKAWAGLGYYARARNLYKCARLIVSDYGGAFPASYSDLLELPGVGPYTAGAIAAIAFDLPATVADGNVERVMARVFAVTDPLPAGKKKLHALAAALSEERSDRSGDYAQGMMDLGATICIPRAPKCGLCPVSSFCEGKRQAIQETLPARAPRGAKPKKFGYVYWIEDGKGRVLYETRPEKGLFGGMNGLPTSNWEHKKGAVTHPEFLKGKNILPLPKRNIRHVFTHFDLTLTPCRVEWKGRKPSAACWTEAQNVSELGLPTLFQKVVKAMK
jgi:A/G-specific adenine glycosylase